MSEFLVSNVPAAERPSMWTRLKNNKLGKLMLAGALLGGPAAVATLAGATPAQAAEVNCYGDYCTGKYADDAGCDKDARTISSTVLSKSGGSLGVSLGPVTANTGNETGEIGVVELRWSQECGTAWARLRTKEASDITYLGIEKDDGYRIQRSTNGRVPGTPAANIFTPMVYGRGDSEFRAYVFGQEFYDPTPDNTGTYWVNAQNA